MSRRKIEVVAPDAPPIDTIEVRTSATDETKAVEYLTLRVWHRVGPWAITSKIRWHMLNGTRRGKSSALIDDPTFAVTYAPTGQLTVRAASVATLAPIAEVFAQLVPGDLPPDYVAILTAALLERGAFIASAPPEPGFRDRGYWIGKLAKGWKRNRGAK